MCGSFALRNIQWRRLPVGLKLNLKLKLSSKPKHKLKLNLKPKLNFKPKQPSEGKDIWQAEIPIPTSGLGANGDNALQGEELQPEGFPGGPLRANSDELYFWLYSANIIHLCMGVTDASGEWVAENPARQNILKGQT